jgi:hypothetical protein
MQERYAVIRITIEQFTRTVQTPQKTFSPYGDSDEESDCSPPTPKNTKATEMMINDSFRIFIEALPHLETLHYGFKFQALGRNGYCFCALAKCLSPWRKNITLIMIIQFVRQDSFMVKVYFNIVVIKGVIITQQLPFILQICLLME